MSVLDVYPKRTISALESADRPAALRGDGVKAHDLRARYESVSITRAALVSAAGCAGSSSSLRSGTTSSGSLLLPLRVLHVLREAVARLR